jgi:hypothetical protein
VYQAVYGQLDEYLFRAGLNCLSPLCLKWNSLAGFDGLGAWYFQGVACLANEVCVSPPPICWASAPQISRNTTKEQNFTSDS